MTDILLIEDQMDLGMVLSDFLTADGYSVYHALSGEDALEYLKREQVKLVILDIMLPGIDGFAVCQLIRKELEIPIIIVTAKVEKNDKINGLLLGADDYIEKPYDIDILLAKVHAIYRRNYDFHQKGNIICEGNLKIEKDKRSVYVSNQEISLTVKEYELLLLLVENKNKALNKDWIFNKVWGVESFSEPSTLTVHIKWLREKIEENPKSPQHIITLWGIGYKFK